MSLLTLNGRLRPAVIVLAFALLLALPSILNGKPFLFYDSTHYYDVGKLISSKVLPAPLPGTEAGGGAADPAPGAAATPADATGGLSSIAGGRSPIYSVLVYVLSSLFTAYGVVAFQCVLVAWVLQRFFRLLAPAASTLSQTIAVAALAFLTPLGFHTAFLMPDIFAGIFVVAALILILDRDLGWKDMLLLTALLAFSATMHATILALGLVLAVLALACRFVPAFRSGVNPKAAGAIAAALLVCAAFGAIYKKGAELVTGHTLHNAPYLAGRVIADGPGARYLETHCDEDRFAICQFQGTRFQDHNDFLWGSYGAAENWVEADPEVKLAVQEEEKAFVIAVVSAYPWQQLQAAFRHTVTQLSFFGIRETINGAEDMMALPAFSGNELMTHVPNLEGCATGTRCQAQNPLRQAWGSLVYACLLATLAAITVLVAIRLPRIFAQAAPVELGSQKILIAGVIVLAVLLANAAVCGSLSGPHDRYQARVAWIAFLVLSTGILYWKSVRPDETAA